MQRRPSFEDLFRLSPNAYLVLDPAFIVLDANPAYLELVGCANEELCGRRLQDLPSLNLSGSEGCLRQMLDSLGRVLAQATTDRLSSLCLVRLGETAEGLGPLERYWSVTHTPVLNEAGDVTAVLQHVVDMTEQRRNEQELAESRARLEAQVSERTRELASSEAERKVTEAALLQAQKLEAVGKLTGGIAHDFNNMLQIIGGNLQLLKRSLADNEAAQRRLESAVSGVQRGARLASQLLAFASRQRLEPQTVELGGLLGEMRDLLDGSLGRGARLDIDSDASLWPVFADVGNLQGAILNLIVNARDAIAGAGRVLLRLRNVSLDAATSAVWPEARPGDYVKLSVIDEGMGMTAEVVERAFEPFFSTKQEGSSSGLGLSMVYGFVRQSGGFVVLESEEHRGTAVHVYLPRELAADGGDAPPVGDAIGDEPAPSLSSEAGTLRVLLVEDDPTLRMLTGEVIGELGHHVVLSESAEAALDQLAAQRFDVLLTDVGLAGMNGIELARQARAQDAGLAVVIASGYAVDAEAQGLSDVQTMLKPYDIHQVRSLLGAIQASRGE